jgi:hypothetical protein
LELESNGLEYLDGDKVKWAGIFAVKWTEIFEWR